MPDVELVKVNNSSTSWAWVAMDNSDGEPALEKFAIKVCVIITQRISHFLNGSMHFNSTIGFNLECIILFALMAFYKITLFSDFHIGLIFNYSHMLSLSDFLKGIHSKDEFHFHICL